MWAETGDGRWEMGRGGGTGGGEGGASGVEMLVRVRDVRAAGVTPPTT